MKRVKIGIIGCGVIGNQHLKAASEAPQIELAAIADLNPQLAETAAQKYGVSKVYHDGNALIQDPEVEAVVLALPACARTELALQAFACGKHVLTEKPVAMNSAEVEKLIEARKGLTAACCSSRYLFLDSAKFISAFLRTGALGQLRVLRCRSIKPAGNPPEIPPPVWRLNKSLNGGGLMSNWGCYDLNYLFGITDWSLRPTTVLAQTWGIPQQYESYAAPGSDAETHTAAFIRCEGGTIITMERAEMAAASPEDSWEIIGEKGSVRFRMKPSKGNEIIHVTSHPESGTVSEVIWKGDDTNGTAHAGPIRDFADAILEGLHPQTTLERALLIQKLTDAIYASSDTGAAIELT